MTDSTCHYGHCKRGPGDVKALDTVRGEGYTYDCYPLPPGVGGIAEGATHFRKCNAPGKGMNTQAQQDAIQRIASAAGHLRGIERMVADDAYCIDVIKQIQAVQAALSKVSTLLLDNHLRTCVTTAIQGDDADERERMLQEITSVFAVKK